MKFKIIINTIVIVNLFIANTFFGQDIKIYKQKDFVNNKVFDSTYHLLWYKSRPFPSIKDTVAYFIDDRNYKGIINYGVEFKSKDFKNFTFSENVSMYFLNVDFTKSKYNIIDSTLEIEGYVSGGWGDEEKNGWNKNESNIEIFIGEKIDTKSPCYFDFYEKNKNVETRLNNKIITNFAILDTFPSFYFKNYTHYKTTSKGLRPFKLLAKVNKNSILVFGSFACYSEIYDIGAMIFSPKKNKTKQRVNKREKVFKPIIINNKLVSNIEKEKNLIQAINYYTYSEKAENFILQKQYSKAKEQYNLLNYNYPTIFTRDIHNAIRCAILSRDLKTAFFWGERLADKGVGIPYFNAKIFKVLKKSNYWTVFNIKYDSLFNANQNKLNLNLKSDIEQLLKEDQNDYGLATRKEPRALYETTERVTEMLIELLRKKGYPSEEKIGAYTKNDTILVNSPNFYVLIRHAIQQKPKNLTKLNELLNKSIDDLEYDSKRSPNNIMDYNSCFHIYKGNLYNEKSCGSNDLMIKKIFFKFNNPHNFIIDNGNFVISEYNKQNPKEFDLFYEQNFNFIMKLTDDWEFYEK
ncbi:hypothetical protein [Flavobacterium sp.]|uniref:hypothetical protein n=1 Tax=Flavobacterium sp. TaxID=239 RepID=UPI00375222F4